MLQLARFFDWVFLVGLPADGIPKRKLYRHLLRLPPEDRQSIASPSERRGDTMNVGFIGAGKVGFSLGKWFAHNGVTVTGYWSRRRESAGEAALFTGTQAFASSVPEGS